MTLQNERPTTRQIDVARRMAKVPLSRVDVNRKDWGVTWNAALEAGGVLVSEKVTLEFEVSAIKATDPS